jgi:predicted GNAT family acetyltransferase
VAGTHLVSEDEDVAALGNIFTRHDRRRQGLSTLVTGAVLRQLVEEKIRTVILNVRRDNDAARRVYERLGFRDYCPYFEAVVVI